MLGWIDAVRGEEERCRARCEETLSIAAAHGLGLQGATARWALGLLELTLGRPEAAFDHLMRILARGSSESHPGTALLAAPDLVEAAVRSDRAADVIPLVEKYEMFAGPDAPAWARALAHRCRALVSDDPDAALTAFETAATIHLSSPRIWDRARTQVLLGEHLRRMRRRTAARPALRAAIDAFERIDVPPWTAQAQAELRATGESVGTRGADAYARLTPQEFQIASLVSAGAANRDVAAQLFLSRRTVEYHLSKIYTRLGISARSELADLDLESLMTSGD